MSSKRILHISPTDIRYDSRILKEIKSLESIPNCMIIAFGINDREGHNYNNYYYNIRTFTIFSKKLQFLPRAIRYTLNFVEAFVKMFFPILKYKPTIIHCHDTLYLPIALIGKILCKSKIIYDAHELESDKAGQSRILSKYTFLIEKFAWKHIELLISVSPSIINWYNMHIGEKNSLLILNSPKLDVTTLDEPNNDYFRKKFNIPYNEKIFLYLGIIAREGRGVNFYLNVFQKKNINSHIIFVGYGNYSEYIKQISLTNPNIHYHEPVPHDKVVEISKSADIGLCMLEKVSLSDYYCLPNKLFEYAFSNLYVLAVDFPDIKEVIDKYKLGQYCSFDENEFVKHVKSIETMQIVSNKVNLYPLSWEYQAELLINNYTKLLN